jgi:single-strand DNA-binding protein
MSARSLNRVQLIGNLTRDPELRYTPQGTAVCTIGLATNRTWVPSDGGERQEETEYHRIVAWAKLAEICSQLLYKGRKVYVEGRLQTRKWTGQDNLEREVTEVVIDNMIALGNPKGKNYGDDDGYEYDYASTEGATAAPTEAVAKEEVPAADVSEPKEEAPAKKATAKEVVDTDDIPF